MGAPLLAAAQSAELPTSVELGDAREHLSNDSPDWQDTGIDLIAGKPLQILASGTWVFHLEVETSAEGLTIPKELRDFPLGCLIGYVSYPGIDPKEARPFVVAGDEPMIVEHSGRLFLRMYDTDPRDNTGVLKVEIRGTFEKK